MMNIKSTDNNLKANTSTDDLDFNLEIKVSHLTEAMDKSGEYKFGTRSCGGTCNSCWTCGGSCPSWC